MSEKHSVETGVPPKMCFGSQGATPRPDSKYAECDIECVADLHIMCFDVLFAAEEDVFQCGKCKSKFTSLSQFIGHKQNQCILAVRTSSTTSSVYTNASVHTNAMTNTNVIYTAQVPHPQANKQITVIYQLYCNIESIVTECVHFQKQPRLSG